jgi:hypothetical protein
MWLRNIFFSTFIRDAKNNYKGADPQDTPTSVVISAVVRERKFIQRRILLRRRPRAWCAPIFSGDYSKNKGMKNSN